MKKAVCLLLLLPCLLMTACQNDPPSVKETFTLDFEVSQEDVRYQGVLDRTTESLTVSVTTPYTVKDTVFRYDSAGLSINYGTHAAQANCDYLPSKSIPTALYNACAYLSQASYTGSDDGADHYTLPTPYGECLLTAANGIPAELYDPNSGLTFHFEAKP